MPKDIPEPGELATAFINASDGRCASRGEAMDAYDRTGDIRETFRAVAKENRALPERALSMHGRDRS